jgi:hypothetical protein
LVLTIIFKTFRSRPNGRGRSALPVKKKIVLSSLLVMLIATAAGPGNAKEAYWDDYHIQLSGLSEQQIAALEDSIGKLESLQPGDLKINPKTYRRLSRFNALFGFPFNGRDLSRWLLTRIRSISYQDSRIVALNLNEGEFFVGEGFFTKTTPVERLYALIHEARHSDDDGYKHVRCPKGFKFISSRQPEFDLEKELACDDRDNGAYSFQAAFLFELFAYGIFDQSEVGLLYNSSISRVIAPLR